MAEQIDWAAIYRALAAFGPAEAITLCLMALIIVAVPMWVLAGHPDGGADEDSRTLPASVPVDRL